MIDNTAYFKDGFLYDVYPRNTSISLYEDRGVAYNARFVISDGIKYDLNDHNSIKAIITPNFKDSVDTTSSLDYVLRMCASNYRNRGEARLSVSILAAATKMMVYSNIGWSLKDFKRIVYWLIEDGRQTEADEWEKLIDNSELVRNKTYYPKMSNAELINITLQNSGIIGSENENEARKCWSSLLEIEEKNQAQSDIDYRIYLSDKAEYNALKENAVSRRELPKSLREYQRQKYNLPKAKKEILESDIEILSLKFRIAYFSENADILIRFREGSCVSEYCRWVLLRALRKIIDDPKTPAYFQQISDRIDRYYANCRIPKKYREKIENDIPKIMEIYHNTK